MQRHFLLLGFLLIGFCCSSCGSKNSQSASSNLPDQQLHNTIDQLIAQHDQDMDQDDERKAFKRVLQSLKEGTLGINDAFIRSGENGGKKCTKEYKWTNGQLPAEPAWQTFLIHIVEFGCTPGNHIPYFEYAKANNADFKVWDMYGRSLLHLVLDFDTDHAEEDLKWLLENTDAKDFICNNKRNEGDPTKERSETTPLSSTSKESLQEILKKHGAK